MGSLKEALNDMNRVIRENLMTKGFGDLAVVLRGEVYCMMRQFDQATQDFTAVLDSESSGEGAIERSKQMLDWIEEVRATQQSSE